MKKASLIAVISGVLLALAVQAQPPAVQSARAGQRSADTIATVPPDRQATKEQFQKLFEVMRLRQQFEEMMRMLPNVMQQQIHMQIEQMTTTMPGAKAMTPEQRTALETLMKKYMEKARTLYPADEMIDDAITVYQRHMERQDVEAYINFFSSPPGQRFLDVQPVIMKEYMPVAMERAQQRTRELNAEMAADLAAFEKSMEPATKPAQPAK